MFRGYRLTLVIIAALAAASHAQDVRGVSMSKLTQPESMIYFLLRDRTAGSTEQRADVERNLTQLRAYAHDRRRQVDNQWLRPADFERQRKAFQDVNKAAEKLFRQATSKRNPTQREKLTQSQNQAAGQAKLRQAAGAWADPLLRTFLLAEAARQAGELGQAENLFARCVSQEPRVAAFYQGQAMTLMNLKRYSQALRIYTNLLTMKPNSREAVQFLRQALQDVPGSNIETPAFRKAKEKLNAYPENTTSLNTTQRETTNWLLPGKTVRNKNHALPDLPMDRIAVTQALAIPVADHTLLVDERILEGAQDVLVQVNSNTLVAASFRKLSTRRQGKVPVAMITVSDYTFKPIPMAFTMPKSDESLQASAVNLYAEMGSEIRTTPVTILSDANGFTTDPNPALAEGETAGWVLTENGQLAGVLVRELDVMQDSPAESLYVASDLATLLHRLPKSTTPRRNQRTITPKKATGSLFLVYAVRGERLSGK